LNVIATVLLYCQTLAAPEVRGTWLTTTANEAVSRPENTAQSMRRLREIGLNTVYVEVWKNGYTEFPSVTMQRATGVPMRVNPPRAVPSSVISFKKRSSKPTETSSLTLPGSNMALWPPTRILKTIFDPAKTGYASGGGQC
jgi:hypothetical protein